MNLTLITPPADEPVSLAEAKRHLRLEASFDDEDDLVASSIKAAREHAESVTRRQLVTASWELHLDAFPCGTLAIALPRPPLQSVTSVKYIDGDGVERTWDAAEYTVVAPAGEMALPGRLHPKYGFSYPATRCEPDAVRIRFVAGYGPADAVPAGIRRHMLLRIGELYERREEAVVGTIVSPAALGKNLLLWPYRVVTF